MNIGVTQLPHSKAYTLIFIPFTVIQIARRSIVTFTFERRDGGKLFDCHSGQYITLRLEKLIFITFDITV